MHLPHRTPHFSQHGSFHRCRMLCGLRAALFFSGNIDPLFLPPRSCYRAFRITLGLFAKKVERFLGRQSRSQPQRFR